MFTRFKCYFPVERASTLKTKEWLQYSGEAHACMQKALDSIFCISNKKNSELRARIKCYLTLY